MRPEWELLMSAYESTEGVLIATADCQTKDRHNGTGAALCKALNVGGYPWILYGDPENPSRYGGDHDYESLLAFAKEQLGPGPPPAPYYEKPPCRSDETKLRQFRSHQIKNGTVEIKGTFCSPSCTTSACPLQLPPGITAQPKCLDQEGTSHKFCVLLCSRDSECDTANGASCQVFLNIPGFSRMGMCTYPEATESNVRDMELDINGNTTSATIVV